MEMIISMAPVALMIIIMSYILLHINDQLP